MRQTRGTRTATEPMSMPRTPSSGTYKADLWIGKVLYSSLTAKNKKKLKLMRQDKRQLKEDRNVIRP